MTHNEENAAIGQMLEAVIEDGMEAQHPCRQTLDVSRCASLLDEELKKWRTRPLGHCER